MAKELSQKWWNVIRRNLRATSAVEVPVDCPDCGGPTHLQQGKYGRFYRCDNNLVCLGTQGARLDGTPRTPRGSPELLEARRLAQAAIRLCAIQQQPDEKDLWYLVEAYGPLHGLKPQDITTILEAAGLPTLGLGFGMRFNKEGLHLRKRSIDELGRIKTAALNLYFQLVEEDNLARRRKRGNAWDKVYCGILED